MSQSNKKMKKCMNYLKQCIIDEKTELDKKLKALSDFMEFNVIFVGLSTAEQLRMKAQEDVMQRYSKILGSRIAAFVKQTHN